MAKVLLVADQFPFPLNCGTNLRTHNFVTALSEEHEVHIAYSSFQDQELVDQYASTYFAGTYFCKIDYDGRVAKAKTTKWTERLNSSWEERSHDRRFEQRLQQIATAGNFDFIVCRYFETARYLVSFEHGTETKIIVDLDDLEYLKRRRSIKFHHSKNSYRYWRLMFDNFLFTRYHNVLRRFDAVCVCSSADKEQALRKRLSEKVFVIPNAVGTTNQGLKPLTRSEYMARKTLLCCGDLKYAPNVDGLLWFLKGVLPRLLRSAPDIRIHMVGRNPDQRLVAAVDNKNVFLFPDVPDVIPYYESASAAIVPLFAGGGTRIKILEAFWNCRPVVSTTIGAEGLNAVHRSHLLIADTEEAFAEACLDLLANYELSGRLTAEGLALVQENYSVAAASEEIKSLTHI